MVIALHQSAGGVRKILNLKAVALALPLGATQMFALALATTQSDAYNVLQGLTRQQLADVILTKRASSNTSLLAGKNSCMWPFVLCLIRKAGARGGRLERR